MKRCRGGCLAACVVRALGGECFHASVARVSLQMSGMCCCAFAACLVDFDRASLAGGFLVIKRNVRDCIAPRHGPVLAVLNCSARPSSVV